MNAFKHWLINNELENAVHLVMLSCISFETNEALKSNIPTAEIAKSLLQAIISSGSGDLKKVMDTIRHNFTNYDFEWKNFQAAWEMPNGPKWRRFAVKGATPDPAYKKPIQFQNPVTGEMSYFDFDNLEHRMKFWMVFVDGVKELLDQVILKLAINDIISDKYIFDLQQENKKWWQTHRTRFFGASYS
jgi:hypothetical protein